MNSKPSPQTEVVIVGAGPAGLFQAFELALLGISCTIIEALPYAGGQCSELYPDKPIYDIPGTPKTRADQLIAKLQTQLNPFATNIEYGHKVTSVQPSENRQSTDYHWQVCTDAGLVLLTKFVVFAVGVGAFSAVKMKTDGIEQFENKQLFYSDHALHHAGLSSNGKSIVVCGDNSAAIDLALNLATVADTTTLVHRTRRLPISERQNLQIEKLQNASKLQLIKGKISHFNVNQHNLLSEIHIAQSKVLTSSVHCDLLLPRLGNSPKLVPFEYWGLTSKSNHIQVSAASFETQQQGLYAVGDINHYEGKRKLILCAFHEATLAAFSIANALQPDKPVHLQYTTTSTQLLKRLGVNP